jgi:hypothetical protein
VRVDVLLGSMPSMVSGMNVVGVRQMRVVSGFLVVARFVMLGGLMVVTRCVLVMFGCLRVMMGRFL